MNVDRLVLWCYILIMATKTTTRRSPGRPREGRDGMRVADFSRVQVYVSPEQHDRLKALSDLLGLSASNLLNDAFDQFVEGLSNAQRQALETVLEAKRSLRSA